LGAREALQHNGRMLISRPFLAAGLLALASPDVAAVSLNPEGLGQALLYPYYTVRASQGNPFNTYISVVNHAGDAKALRVRLREGRNSREVLSFNLYLSPYDAWTAALVPTAEGGRLVTTDRSCTDPVIDATGIDLSASSFQGANDDANGSGPDRTREGFLEILEMATLTGTSAAAVTQGSNAIPSNCAAIRTGTPLVAAPTGDLSGTLTLINVASGLDFTVNATALSDLALVPFYRPPGDPYPSFEASEILPTSIVRDASFIYQSRWERGVDAVSAVLMRQSWTGEYVLDEPTQSLTDFVLTLPTRQSYVGAQAAVAPFNNVSRWSPTCLESGTSLGEPMSALYVDRESRRGIDDNLCEMVCPPPDDHHAVCAASAVARVLNGAAHAASPSPPIRSSVLASTTLGLNGARVRVAASFPNGWIALRPSGNQVTSLPGSQRIDSTGAVHTGRHRYHGLPGIGFAVRTFSNGTLACAAGACQGNYGGAFPLFGKRQIEILP
jgi:hypothetical protein